MGKESIKVRKIGQYILQKKIGQGSMGTIWLSHHMGLDIPVAVKLLKPSLIEEDPEYIDRFIKEGNLAGSIHHKNIIRIFDAGCQSGTYYMVMEYVDGGNAQELLDSRGALTPDEVVEFAIKICDALIEAHAHNVIHRDIKPENIMLTKEGRLKVADLGLAKRLDDDFGGSTMHGAALGTPNYISPEQTRNALAADSRSDIYSLGATLYHLLTGRVPFDGESCVDIMMKHCSDELVPPSEYVEALPKEINNIICKMMQKLPEDRPQSCQEIYDEFNRIKYKEEGNSRLVSKTQINLNGIDLDELKAKRKAAREEKQKEVAQKNKKKMIAGGVVLALFIIIALVATNSKAKPFESPSQKAEKPTAEDSNKSNSPIENKASKIESVNLDDPVNSEPEDTVHKEDMIDRETNQNSFTVSSEGENLLEANKFHFIKGASAELFTTDGLYLKLAEGEQRQILQSKVLYSNYRLILKYVNRDAESNTELIFHRDKVGPMNRKVVINSKSNRQKSATLALRSLKVQEVVGDEIKYFRVDAHDIDVYAPKKELALPLGEENTLILTCFKNDAYIKLNEIPIMTIKGLPNDSGRIVISSIANSDITITSLVLYPLKEDAP